PLPLGMRASPLQKPAPETRDDWRRFWELFSADKKLNDSEISELNHIKLRLRDLHQALEREEKRKAEDLRMKVQIRLSELGIDDERSDYIVHRDDYKRGTEKEREYIRLHRNFLFRTYDNRCGKCANDSNGLDIDHFFFSKNEGGCFQMRHRSGFYVNNAIPLCESCNRSKSDRHYRAFFSPHDLLRVMELNAKLNDRLNQSKITLFKKLSWQEAARLSYGD
ncbi:MAG: endonuclease, partial [Bacteriovoracaceae bacterium]|nr:endonuclease [Bacteriovoracaceae bacterium]